MIVGYKKKKKNFFRYIFVALRSPLFGAVMAISLNDKIAWKISLNFIWFILPFPLVQHQQFISIKHLPLELQAEHQQHLFRIQLLLVNHIAISRWLWWWLVFLYFLGLYFFFSFFFSFSLCPHQVKEILTGTIMSLAGKFPYLFLSLFVVSCFHFITSLTNGRRQM